MGHRHHPLPARCHLHWMCKQRCNSNSLPAHPGFHGTKNTASTDCLCYLQMFLQVFHIIRWQRTEGASPLNHWQTFIMIHLNRKCWNVTGKKAIEASLWVKLMTLLFSQPSPSPSAWTLCTWWSPAPSAPPSPSCCQWPLHPMPLCFPPVSSKCPTWWVLHFFQLERNNHSDSLCHNESDCAPYRQKQVWWWISSASAALVWPSTAGVGSCFLWTLSPRGPTSLHPYRSNILPHLYLCTWKPFQVWSFSSSIWHFPARSLFFIFVLHPQETSSQFCCLCHCACTRSSKLPTVVIMAINGLPHTSNVVDVTFGGLKN